MEGSSQSNSINTPLTTPSPSCTPMSSNAPPVVEEGAVAILPLPPTSGKRQLTMKTSEVCKHFTMEKVESGSDLGPRAYCNHCHTDYACDPVKNGTYTLVQYLGEKCAGGSPLRGENKQKTFSFEKKGALVAHAYSQERSRLACVKMIILDNLPFRHVEGIGFRQFMSEVQPEFDPPSRITIARDVWNLFQDHKAKIKSVLSLNSQRVSLTIDTRTSIQNVNYMALTAHFIDDGWKLHKILLNFCQITNHKGNAIGRLIEDCLLDWDIEKVFTITADNDVANDVAIRYIKKRLGCWNTLLFDGDLLYMRCCAHINNLIVYEGLNELHDSIKSIRKACRYTRSSPSRLENFRHYLLLGWNDNEALLPLEYKTRWNSTYFMLEAALKLQRGFERLEEEDSYFATYFEECGDCGDEKQKKKKRKVEGDDEKKKKVRPPTATDWDYVRAFIKILKRFYEATLKFSSYKTVTSNVPFHEMCSIVDDLNSMITSGDPFMERISTSMKKKYDKHWGSVEEVNQLMIVAVVLDPCYKMDYVEYSFGDLEVDASKIDEMTLGVKDLLMRLYEHYKKENPESAESYVKANVESCGNLSASKCYPMLERFIRMRKEKVGVRNEVDEYLLEAPENPTNLGFNLLDWWRKNSPRFPVLSKVAKDIFSIPVSSVPSEDAFIVGNRVVDPFRACLTPKTVEAFICTNDWLRSEAFDFNKEPTENDIDFYKALEKMENEIKKFQLRGKVCTSSATASD